MYAVVKIQWHQYIVKKWDEITVDLVDAEEGKKVAFDTVLLWFTEDGSNVVFWAPTISGASVTAKVVSHKKDKKMRVIKFQGKKRYTKTKWFRAQKSVLSIEWVKIDG